MSNLFDQLSKNHDPIEPEKNQPIEESKKAAENVHDVTLAIILSKMGSEGLQASHKVKVLGDKKLVAEEMLPFYKRQYAVNCSRDYIVLLRETL